MPEGFVGIAPIAREMRGQLAKLWHAVAGGGVHKHHDIHFVSRRDLTNQKAQVTAWR